MARRVTKNLTSLRNENFLAQAMRVNHAGEYGAVFIYSGQGSVLSKTAVACEISEMKSQEEAHLEFFNQQIVSRKVRPTALLPVWRVLGFSLGAITAILGTKAAMACTVAVEDVIADHYLEQIEQLEARNLKDEELKEKIIQIRNEELEHQDIAITHDAEQAVFYEVLSKCIKKACKFAIIISKVV